MIRVLLFAGMQERAGTAELQLDEERLRISDIKSALEKKYDFPKMFIGCLSAVNEEFADDDTEVSTGDTVAFIPPVSGG
ncbi:MoaD/ThiS family protein [Fictibacillus sp. WQ 8-8]|uniref:MoaD/ThiS family protein n=1 Tax=unclassified Fictibacillus TaxID=2644029 RepID=UPI0006A79F13|nr:MULTISPECIES: MoaD/ThiS family protein [unclassified Fictibacillus]MCQ6265511.1 MoaD/ThiS family protein [Fictibacillus sp. WQ 8-8]MED2973589.1 MoaD/ThiS family protein [Fictibacillus sp. B-59209]UZJ77409.1 MoaD/ThiS family protein [Fictibacillus sp. KU28468]